MHCDFSRRRFLAAAGALAGARPLRAEAPTSPVALARCTDYGMPLWPTMAAMFDQLGGLGRLVKNKTVAIKVNLTGSPSTRLNGEPVEYAQWVHQDVIGVMVFLLGVAGARRIRVLEGFQDSAAPLEALMIQAGWDPEIIRRAAPLVEFENTNCIGAGSRYVRFPVPAGGWIFPAYDLNHSYEDCDVFISLAKLKQHVTAGLTLSMKNLFGIWPTSIYGNSGGVDGPREGALGNRSSVGHTGTRKPALSAPQENDPASPRDPGYRMPRIITELTATRPIHLAVIDGIETMAGGEGPWNPKVRRVSPQVLLAGFNPVTTDAVAAAVMGFDPMAPGYQVPYSMCDSTLLLAEVAGLGTRDLARIEVLGTPIEQARYPF